MKQIAVSSWPEFEDAISELGRIQEEFDKREITKYGTSHVSRWFFRGQGSALWTLSTTLERYWKENVPLLDYYVLASKAQPRVESFTGERWDSPTFEEYQEWTGKVRHVLFGDFPGYDYYAYLRHNGFPSPLLDWTLSPYIAAHFAFHDAPPDAESVAVFAYLEDTGLGKSGGHHESAIKTLSSYVRTHKRHFLQQCQYTVCTQFTDGEPHYANHESVVARANAHQDLIWKLSLPKGLAGKVLKRLSLMNVTPFSLFGSEESLLQTIAIDEHQR